MNWPTILVAILVAVVVLGIIIRGIRNKKKGGSACSCGCGACSMRESCHPQK